MTPTVSSLSLSLLTLRSWSNVPERLT
jgi:hypothetical protein